MSIYIIIQFEFIICCIGNAVSQPHPRSQRYSSALQACFHFELQLYIAEEIDRTEPDDEFNIKQWWQLKKSKFPTSHKIFMKYFFVPASSSAVESEFSYTGLVITDRRSRILPEHVNDLMVARNNCL